MTTTGVVNPTSMPASSERYMPAYTSKRTSTTQDVEMQRKERSFQECLEFLMPVYLLPFIFGDRPHVLEAFLLFAIAILGDETTVFFRLCLYALQRYALRMQPLFLYLQFLVFALSLLLPSNLIVIFSTVFIDRFVTTVHNEIVGNADQRSSVRIQTSSALNYFDEARRPRWIRRSSVPTFNRRARSVSVVSDTTVASEASAGSSVIRHYRMYPAATPLEAPDTTPSDWKTRKGVRKTSFGGFDQYEGDQPCHLPVRRIRSFSAERNQPSSILKRSPAPPPPPSSPLVPYDQWAAGITRGIQGRRSTLPMGEFWMQEPALLATPRSSHDWHEETSTPRTVPTSIAISPSTPTYLTGFTGAEQQTSSMKVRALTNSARPAFIAGAAYTAIFGNLVNLNTVTTRKALFAILGCQDDDCPVNFWSWLSVSLPVALICCVTSWMAIYCNSLVSCYLEGPLLGLTLLGLSVSPAHSLRSCWTHRILCWRELCSRTPWNIVLMLGSVMALTRTIEDFRLIEIGLSQLDDHFWSQRSTKSCQFILVSVAAILSEIVLGDSLTRSMATTVVRVAVVTETPVSFYVVPVSLAAAINVMLPVSLPLLVMREYLHTKCAQMVAYGVFLKCASVVAILLLMNTIGIIVFQGDAPSGRHIGLALNASHIDTDFL